MKAKTIKKVVLCVPNFKWRDVDDITYWHFIPYNICMIASMIRKDYEVKILDANFENLTLEQFGKIIKEESPDVIGLSVLMDHYGITAHKAAKIIKETNKEIVTVIGGVYATTNSRRVIKDENIDYLIAGEGEYSFKELLNYIEDKSKDVPRGIWYKDNGEIYDGGRADFIDDLDSLPLPSYDLIEFDKYSNWVERKSVDCPSELPYARIFTSRGCRQHCVFCQVDKISGHKFRARSTENILKEIRWLKEKYNIKSIIIDDDNFFTDRDRIVELLNAFIEEGLNLKWKSIATALFHLDDELLELMKKSGCEYMDIAIESGCERILKEIIHKPVDKKKAIAVAKKAKEVGIFVTGNFIVGFPGETWDEIRETLKFAEEIDLDYVKIFNAVPLPNTKLYDLAIETNSLLPDFDPYNIDWKHGFIQTSEFSVRDLAVLRAYEWDRINFLDKNKRIKIANMMQITEEELLKIRRKTLESLNL